MKLSWLLLARLLAGGVGFLPPLVAASLLDGLQYGLGASSFAVGMLVIGPVAQYAKQGYLRSILLPDRPDISAWHILFVFLALVIAGMVVSHVALGVPLMALAAIFVAVCSLAIVRIEEVRQVALDRQLLAVCLFYVVPPVMLTVLFAASWFFALRPDWVAISLAMSMAYLVPSLLSIVLRRGLAALSVQPMRMEHVRLLWTESRTFLVSGIVMSATESLPTLALTALGVPQAVATFELVRKLSSAVSVFLHGLSIAFAPRLIKAAAEQDWTAVRGTIWRNTQLSIAFAAVYLPLAVAAVLVLGRLGWIHASVSFDLALPLFASAFVTCVAAPFGMAVAALNSEKWWVIGGFLGVASFAATLAFAPLLGAAQAVAVAVLIQNLVLSLTISLVVSRLVFLHRGEGASPKREVRGLSLEAE
ncbi:hypothetical protein WBP07_11290 [Novosphingobium sp. BL-8A]|uniref:hypothetical protein n=1 Tax=Novosphingobium sp. BL-8A TaxID=3127639 RepID=UPI003757665F